MRFRLARQAGASFDLAASLLPAGRAWGEPIRIVPQLDTGQEQSALWAPYEPGSAPVLWAKHAIPREIDHQVQVSNRLIDIVAVLPKQVVPNRQNLGRFFLGDHLIEHEGHRYVVLNGGWIVGRGDYENGGYALNNGGRAPVISESKRNCTYRVVMIIFHPVGADDRPLQVVQCTFSRVCGFLGRPGASQGRPGGDDTSKSTFASVFALLPGFPPKLFGGPPQHAGKEGDNGASKRGHQPAMIVKPVDGSQDRGRYNVPTLAVIWGAILALAAYFGKVWADERYGHVVADEQRPQNQKHNLPWL